jgi:hypothetical protein
MPAKAAKVYVITANLDGTTWAEAIRNTFALEKDIALLARKSGTPVHFHQYKKDVLGAPVVLLECPASFLEKVKRLPSFDSVHPLRTGIATLRREDMPQVEPPQAQRPGTSPPAP